MLDMFGPAFKRFIEKKEMPEKSPQGNAVRPVTPPTQQTSQPMLGSHVVQARAAENRTSEEQPRASEAFRSIARAG
ncbi:hypothetical protein NDU88_003285 [Pleurodeles waltl]|uniref:Uncharacterized protein n=1 Tax=Pleurodeles waltl TaxID=8319 RepID=A0AAV7UER7_PLEWA|nr:hypothetical protein NDU88_003285 [Pleurodeles waltl]